MTIYTVDSVFEETAGAIQADSCSMEYWNLSTVLDTGAIDITDEYGTEVSGLSVGDCYAIEAYNGPYSVYSSDSPYNTIFYSFGLTLDGTSWVGTSGWAGYDDYDQHQLIPGVERWWLSKPNWVLYAEWVSSAKIYARVYWIASTTSVWIGCHDGEGEYDDNDGSLSYRLWSCGKIHTTGCRLV